MFDQSKDCPGCGAKDSAWSDGLCGACEGKRATEQAEQDREELVALAGKIAACPCEEGDCSSCVRNYAHSLAIQGDEAGAARALNL